MSKFSDANVRVVAGQLRDAFAPGSPPHANFTAFLKHTIFYPGFISRSNPRDKKRGHFTAGGAFWSVKAVHEAIRSPVYTAYHSNDGAAYTGTFGWETAQNLGVVPDPRVHNYNNARTHQLTNSARLYNKLRPDKPNFELALNLLELKDLPAMLQDSVRTVRDVVKQTRKNGSSLSKTGEYYLAVNFGWLPVLGGVRDFVKTQREQQKRLTQLIRDSGKPVSRKIKIPETEESTLADTKEVWHHDAWAAGMGPQGGTFWYPHEPYYNWHRSRTVLTSKLWAAGKFRYFLPPGPRDVVWTRNMLRRINGIRVTPSTVYNLMPWTWLADYFIELGEFVDAVSPGVADRLATEYFYVMWSVNWTTTTEGTVGLQQMYVGKPSVHPRASVKSQVAIMSRYPASPFGFGFTGGNLSSMQLAILGALGLSKLP